MSAGFAARAGFWGGYWLPSFLGALLHPPRRPATSAPRVVAVLLPEHIGDVVMTGPLLRSLRRRYPETRLLVAARPQVAPLLRGCPHLDEVADWPPGRPAAEALARRLRAEGCDLAVVPRSDADTGWAPWVAARCGAAERVTLTASPPGPRRLQRLQGPPFFNVSVFPAPEVAHEVRRRLALVRHWGGDAGDPVLESWATAADRAAVAPWLAGLPAGRAPVAFGLGASQAFRRWPAEQFAALIDRLAERRPLTAVLVVGPGEETLAAEVRARVRTPVAVPTAPTLRETAAILERCAFFVGNDSGPGHLAAAAGIPVAVISAYAPGLPATAPGSPEKCRPFGPRVRVLQPAAAVGEGVVGVTVEAVAAAVHALGFGGETEAGS
jgi:heptosyltransferase-2